ncbi:MAG: MFS transporter [Polyangiaceae bacterium]
MSPIALLFVALFNSILGLSLLFPILGPLGRQLGMTELQVGALTAGYAVAQFAGSPYWGRRSEVLGRKPVLLRGILGFGVTFLAFALLIECGQRGVLSAQSLFFCLLGTRLLGGLFSSATLPTAQAYVADVTGRADRTAGMSVIGAAFGLALIFGPVLAGLLARFGLLLPIYVSTAVAFLNAGFVWLKLPEPATHLAVRRAPDLLPVAAKVWVVLGVGFSTTLASVCMEQTLAFYFQDRLGLSHQRAAETFSWSLGVYGLVAVLVQGFFVRRVKWPPLLLLRAGVPIAASGLVALVFASGTVSLIVAMALQGLGQALALPGVTSALSLSVDEGEQGAVAGLNGASQSLGRMLGPVLGTGLYQLRPEYPYGFGTLILCCVFGFLLLSRAPALRSMRTHEAAPAKT